MNEESPPINKTSSEISHYFGDNSDAYQIYLQHCRAISEQNPEASDQQVILLAQRNFIEMIEPQIEKAIAIEVLKADKAIKDERNYKFIKGEHYILPGIIMQKIIVLLFPTGDRRVALEAQVNEMQIAVFIYLKNNQKFQSNIEHLKGIYGFTLSVIRLSCELIYSKVKNIFRFQKS